MQTCNIDDLNSTIVGCDQVAGMERKVYIIPREDYLLATKTFSTDNHFLKSIALPTGSSAFSLKMAENQVIDKITGATNDAMLEEYTPEITCYAGNDTGSRFVVNAMANNLFVVITEQKFKGINNLDAFMVHGTTAGLKANVTRDSGAMSNLNVVTFTTFDNSKETTPPLSFTTNENTDTYAADKAYLEALLTPAS